jgi:hypothetical protein
MAKRSLVVVSPVVARPRHSQWMTERPSDLNNTVVGFREEWWNFPKFTEALEQLLRRRYSIKGVERTRGVHTPTRQGKYLESWNEFQKRVDWAVVGLGA